jgi:hypothetical protein
MSQRNAPWWVAVPGLAIYFAVLIAASCAFYITLDWVTYLVWPSNSVR